MAANDYYATHPQNATSYGLTQQPDSSHLNPQYTYSQSASSDTSSRTSSDSHTSDRGFLTPSSHKQPGLKKSKSDRALKFVEKQVKKQIDKKLNGGSGKQGNNQQWQDQVVEATQGDSTGANGGEYGYGDASGGYGASGGEYGNAASGAGGGDYGYGDSSGGYGMTGGDFGGAGGGDGGNFDFGGAGEGSGGFWESLTSGDFDFDM
ncbi:hypothetical protein IQ06DRAFT_295781 [Phaeosphaeriaceae sp. SRC1lsM3a]|nr:hypothetical protein IQ06DRAFT_295781 [Stagonospora sp. SRC1lsM3a]